MKRSYKIRNWPEYNKALTNRGNITLWISEESIKNRYSTDHTCQAGRPRLYSDEAILCALMVRSVYKLPLRALVGLLTSLIALLGLTLLIPSASQLCRRARTRAETIKRLSSKRPTDIVFDSTGLKVYGEGEWKTRQHGKSKRRTWRKLHIGVDPNSHELIVATLTTNDAGDAAEAEELVKKLPKSVKRAYGDGAFDSFAFRRALSERGVEGIIVPPKNAVVHAKAEDDAIKKRNEAIKEMVGLGGDAQARALWKKLHGYHTRSPGETAMYRFKQLMGGGLVHRRFDSQHTGALVKCLIINRMTRLGMPKGAWVVA